MKVILDHINFPEGPCFDKNGNVWLVEKEAGNLIIVENGIATRFEVDGAPNGIAIDSNNLVWFCDSKQNSIRTFDLTTKTTNTIVDQIEGKPLKMPNDLTFNKQGDLLFTCPGDNLDDNTGYICHLKTDKTLSIIYKGMFYPNGLALNKEQTALFVAETGKHKIWKFDWDGTKLANKILFAETGGPIGPDGIAFDEDGDLYVAVYGSGMVKSWDKNGVLKNQIDAIGKNPTNCAIDPSGKFGLVITEAEKGLLIQYPLKKRGII